VIGSAHTAPLGIALLGLMLGMRHATDPDHVIAITTVLTRERRIGVAARIGTIWGLGHTATVLAVGSAIIFFKLAIPVHVGIAMELGVALVLIILGLSNIARHLPRFVLREPDSAESLVVHSHPHSHGGVTHRHVHLHAAAYGATSRPSEVSYGHDELHREHLIPADRSANVSAGRPMLKSFGIGLVHGLSGSVAIALLVLSAIPQPLWAGLYLVVFCCGTILGMALITTAIAAPMFFASGRISWLRGNLEASSGLLSLGFGIFLVYQLAIA
jgi:ABC-type nickel/cobalt efflux system permease component RcnA